MMRKKIIPIILAAALLLAGLGIYVSANRSRTQMQLMGQAYAEASGRTDDPVIAAFKGTEIRQSRIDYEKQIMTVMEGRTGGCAILQCWKRRNAGGLPSRRRK